MKQHAAELGEPEHLALYKRVSIVDHSFSLSLIHSFILYGYTPQISDSLPQVLLILPTSFKIPFSVGEI